MKTKFTRILFTSLFALSFLAGCGKGEKTSIFSIEVKNKVGVCPDNVKVGLFKNGEQITAAYADDGVVKLQAPEGDYEIKLVKAPAGYYLSETQPTTKGVYNYDITLSSRVAVGDPNEDDIYTVGDIIYDNTFISLDDKEYTFSEILKEKDFILINFWYTTCGNCVTEFPYLNEAYEMYKDVMEVIALDPFDDKNAMANFIETMELTLPAAQDDHLFEQFGIIGYPTSVIIDRYGMICWEHAGYINSYEEFANLFERFIGDDYYPMLSDANGNFYDPVTATMPDSKAIENAINGEGYTFSYYAEKGTDKDSTWPFVLSSDGKSLMPSNSGHAGSYASIYSDVKLKKGDVIAFDYLSSTEKDNDILYVLVDREVVAMISGVETEWKSCYAYVADDDGDHTLAFCYYKDSTKNIGDDAVYIKNMRITKESAITEPTTILRNCASGNVVNGRYSYYITPVLNNEDGFYHVDKADGPLIFANMTGSTRFSPYGFYTLLQGGYLTDETYDATDIITSYSSYSVNSTLSSLTPVTAELKDALVKCIEIYARGVEDRDSFENEWLELCSYYKAYNQDELENPIVGLAPFCAYEGHEGDNKVTFETPTMPRGLLTSFKPSKSGVYFVKGTTQSETFVTCYDKDMNVIFDDDMVVYRHHAMNDTDDNFKMYVYLEAGETYYIRTYFWDFYEMGDLTFNISYYAESADVLMIGSPGFFTTEGVGEDGIPSGKIIALGIDVALDSEGWYRVKNKDGSLGSYIYADFLYTTSIFPEDSLVTILNKGGFDFTKKVDGGKDYTDDVFDAYDRVITEEGDYKGLVKVDAKLGEALQALMDYYTFQGVDHSWTKLCWYVEHVGAK